MSTAESTRLMTAEEFYDFCHRPENRDRLFELERGEVVEMSRPGELHGVACANVTFVLGSFVRHRRKGYICTNDTGVIWERAPDTVKGPDIIFFDENRRYDDLAKKYPERIPRLIVEVRSPNDRTAKLIRRIEKFLQRGSSVAWLVDPEERTVTVYRLNQFPQAFDEDEELTGGDELPDFRCRVADFFIMPGE
jgi:Uma2 family endonuclease